MNIMESLKGFTVAHFLYVGVKSGIFDLFCKRGCPLRAEEVANELSLTIDYVKIWLDTGLAFGYCNLSNDAHYKIVDEYEHMLLNREHPAYLGGLIEIFVAHLSKDMRTQPEYMRNGRHYSFSEHDDEFIELISERGSLRAQIFKTEYLDKTPDSEILFQNNASVCDVGCGSGTFLGTLKSYYPSLQCIGIDQDEKSIALAKKRFSKDGISFDQADIATSQLIDDLSCITMVLSLHEINYANRSDVVKACYHKLRPNGRLFVMEFPYPETSDEYRNSRFTMGVLDQYFEMTWGTQHMGWSSQKSLIESAGFSEVSKTFLENTPYMVITAIKKA